jgi:hypothetical protein
MEWVSALRIESANGEARLSRRHKLALDAQAAIGDSAESVMILDLSSTGLLIDSPRELDLDEQIDVELPHGASVRAQVVWRSGNYHGCAFVTPVSSAAVSAARLRSMPGDIQGTWGIDQETAGDAESLGRPGFSPRRKTAIIVGMACACWAPIILAVALIS